MPRGQQTEIEIALLKEHLIQNGKVAAQAVEQIAEVAQLLREENKLIREEIKSLEKRVLSTETVIKIEKARLSGMSIGWAAAFLAIGAGVSKVIEKVGELWG